MHISPRTLLLAATLVGLPQHVFSRALFRSSREICAETNCPEFPVTEIVERQQSSATVPPPATSAVYPSTTNPSVTNPSVTSPSTTSPSATNPTTTYTSTTDPSATNPSVTSPSTTSLSATDSTNIDTSTASLSTTNPSTTDPFTITTSTTSPSATDPPTSDTSTAGPSTTNPSTTMYSSTTSTTDSPATDPPATTSSPATSDPLTTVATRTSDGNSKTTAPAHPSIRPSQGSNAPNNPFAPGNEGIPHGRTPILGEGEGGPSGDGGPDAGGFGSDPVPFTPQNWKGWTGYDDLNNLATPDKARDALEVAIKRKIADKEASPFTHRYDLSDKKEKDTSPKALYNSAAEHFSDFHLSAQDQYIQRFVRNKGPQGRLNRSPVINEAAFSRDGKVVIAAYSDTDKDAVAPADRTRWSEFVFQQMKQYAEDKTAPYDIKNLQFLVRVNVGNPGTIATIKKAFLLNGLSFEKDRGVFRASARSGTAEATAFDAILRTENVKGVNWMLGDHHTELGDKRIKALYIYPERGFPNIFIEVE